MATPSGRRFEWVYEVNQVGLDQALDSVIGGGTGELGVGPLVLPAECGYALFQVR